MAKSTSESGFAVLHANMGTALVRIDSLGDSFNPTHPLIKKDVLTTFLQEAGNAQKAVKDKKEAFDRAINARRDTYAGLLALSTRIVNAYADSGASKADVADLRATNKKLQGPSRKTATPQPGEDAKGKHSTSQRSFANAADFFDTMISKCAANRSYAPGEADLTTDALRGLHQRLLNANTAVDNAEAPYRQALAQRNRLFLDTDSGLTARGKNLRGYFKTRIDNKDLLKGLSFSL